MLIELPAEIPPISIKSNTFRNYQDAVSMDQQMLRVLFNRKRNCNIGSKIKEDILYGKQFLLYLLKDMSYVLTFIFTIIEFGWLDF